MAITEIRSMRVDSFDKLVMESQTGFSQFPDKLLYLVYYCERFEDTFYPGEETYNVCNTEYFETMDEATRAFDIRDVNDPFHMSGLRQFEFPPYGLGDILADALKRKEEV